MVYEGASMRRNATIWGTETQLRASGRFHLANTILRFAGDLHSN